MTQHTNRHWTRLALVMATALTAGACGVTEPVALDEEMLADVALMAADATLEDVALWAQPFGASPTLAPEASPGLPGGGGGWSGEFSGTRSITFYDEAGAEMDGYDELLTESIVIEHEIEGEVSREGWSASIFRSRSKTVSGLLGEETTRTWNGTGNTEVSRSSHLDDGTERSYSMVGSSVYEDVVVPIPGSDSRYPLSGTITRTITVTRVGPDGEMVRTVEVVITFDGSATATATVNGEPIEIDLSARDGRNPVRMGRRG